MKKDLTFDCNNIPIETVQAFVEKIILDAESRGVTVNITINIESVQNKHIYEKNAIFNMGDDSKNYNNINVNGIKRCKI